MAADESHDEALPKTAHVDGPRWILPVYHGNGAETDLMAVGDVDWVPIFNRFMRRGQFAFA
jgi:hypothetical protein